MPFTLVQKKTAVSTGDVTSLSVTLSPAATAGNLIVVCGNGDNFKSGDPSGFTLAVGATDFTGTYIWYKVAAGGETTITHTILSATSIELAAYEYTLPLASPLDVTASATHGDVTSATTGTTATTAQADELAIAMFGGFSGTGDITSWSNSFLEDDDLLSTGSAINDRMWVAHKDLSATGTQTTTATFGATSSHPIGLIATFKSAAPAAGRVSFRPGKTWKRRYKHRQRLPIPPSAGVDVRNDTVLSTVGLSADVTTKKVAVVSAVSSLGLSGTATAAKVAKSTGVAAVGLSSNFVHLQISAVTATGTLGLTSTSTAKKVTPTISVGTVGLAGTVTAKKVTSATLRSTVGLAGIVTARKIAPVTGLGTVGLQANFVHADIHPITALGGVGLTALATTKKRATPLAAGTLGLTGNALPKKISKSTGLGELPIVGLVVVRKKQAITGRGAIGLTAWWEILPVVVGGDLYVEDRKTSGITAGTRSSTSVDSGDRSLVDVSSRSRDTADLTGDQRKTTTVAGG